MKRTKARNAAIFDINEGDKEEFDAFIEANTGRNPVVLYATEIPELEEGNSFVATV